jgi:thiamine monophosphate kinase
MIEGHWLGYSTVLSNFILTLSLGSCYGLGFLAKCTSPQSQAGLSQSQAGLSQSQAGLSRDPAGPDWLRWVLTGGDDHALVATFPAQTALPPPWTVLGTVANGRGIAIDGQIWSESGGWEHFRS